MRPKNSRGKLEDNKVLIIAYYFPPIGGPGVLRPLKLAKYLRSYGWQPIVLTVKPFTYYVNDETNLREVDFPVFKTESFDPARMLFILGKRKSEGGVVNWPRRLINLPDTRGGWLPFGVHLGMNLARSCRAVISTAPPFTAHLIGLLIARYHSIPLVTDFRDLWIDFPYLPYYPWQRPFIRYLQGLVLKNATWVTAAFDDIVKSFPDVFHNKTTVIYNGYDPADFNSFESPKVFTISHMGSITQRRRIDPIVSALQDIAKDIGEFRLQLIGYIHPEERNKIAGRVDNLKIYGYLDHKEALKRLSGSHLLLLLNSPLDSPAPGRQAEYAATGLPIVVVGHERSCPILRRLARNKYPISFIDYHDPDSLRRAIIKSWAEYREGRLKRYGGNLDFLNRKKQAAIFSRILDSLCGY